GAPLVVPGAGPDPWLGVARMVGARAGEVVLLPTADAVPQSRRPRPRPGAGERLRIPRIRLEALGIGAEPDLDALQLARLGDPPRLLAVGDGAVREDDHRRHVADGDPRCF